MYRASDEGGYSIERIKKMYPLFPLQSGVIVQIPNNRSAIVELEDKRRELVDIKDLEVQVLVECSSFLGKSIA